MQIDNEVLDAIFSAVQEFNAQLPPGERLQSAVSTIIAGEGGSLDSLGLVSFLVLLEDTVSARFGTSMSLLQESYLKDPQGPLTTLGSIAEHVAKHRTN